MAGQIEKMTRMRKSILFWILAGTVIAFCLNILPTLYTLFQFNRNFIFIWKYRLFDYAVFLWFLSVLIFLTRYWLYKKKLKKDPFLQTAVYDERAKLNWLISNRNAFLISVGLTIIYKCFESFFSGQLLNMRFTLPNGPFFVLWGAITALVGSFLYYNREAKNE